VKRGERQRRNDRRAIAVGDDAAVPGPTQSLGTKNPEMARVDLGDDERHIRFHSVVLRVGEHEPPRTRERGLDGAGDGRVERREHDVRGDRSGVAGKDPHGGYPVRYRLVAEPSGRLAV
jgi:hypothetical protein